jgi:monovalent cation:H+ antiporter-2, CPA2 family
VQEVPLLVNIAMAVVAALAGGLVARKAGVPTIVGYLLAGVTIGPFTPGFVGDTAAIGQLAELGVVFLMFGVGLHFSLADLWQVRRVAIPGALVRMAIATVLGYALARTWGWSMAASVMLGLSISIASTVVLVRGLMDGGLLDSQPGRVAVGWVVVEDLATVLLLLVLPAFSSDGAGPDLIRVGLTLLKAAAFVGLMLLVGKRIVPWTLLRIAHTRSRELFLLMVLTVALGIALGAAAVFGVSLALGAFLAGTVVRESPLSLQVGADVLPFREAFAVLFFVSVGMLVDPRYLLAHAGQVLALTALVVVGKAVLALLIGALLRQPLRTGVVLAAGLSQIGEFSFILGEAGVRGRLLQPEQYSMILATAVLSITLNPLLFGLARPLELRLTRWAALRRWLERQQAPEPSPVADSGGHVVIVGSGRVGRHIVDVLGTIGVPRLVVEIDWSRAQDLRRQGVPALFGDAANSEILDHAGLPKARALVITVPQEATASLVVAGARRLAASLPIVARAATRTGVKQLAELGAQDVIHPELEGGLEVVRHTLLRLGFPLREVQRYVDLVRQENYETRYTHEEHRALDRLLEAVRSLEIGWTAIPQASSFAGKSLAEADLRARTGASVVAIQRGESLIANPPPDMRLEVGDRLGLIGESDQVEAAERLVHGSEVQSPMAMPSPDA